MSLFADDCDMYLSGNNWNELQRRIQCDFDSVVDWSFRNSLRLNHSKTKSIIFSIRNRLSNMNEPTPFHILDKTVKFVKSHVYLGVTLDATMSLIPLIKSVKRCVTNKVFKLRKIRK